MKEATAYLTDDQLPYFHTKGTNNIGKETALEHY